MSAGEASPPLSFALLRHPLFLRFWLARGLSTLGYMMLTVALSWQVYDLTGSALYLGLIGLVQLVPTLLLTFPAGHVADRNEQRGVLALCMAGYAGVALLLAAANAAGTLPMGLVWTLALTLGAARAFEGPSGSVMLVSLVPRHVVSRAITSELSIRQTAMIAGPGIGGLLYEAGPVAAYAVCGGVYVASLLLLVSLPRSEAPPDRDVPSARSLFAGIGFIRAERAVQGAMWLDLLALLIGSCVALLPVFARDILHAQAVTLGLLRGSRAVGAVAVAIALSRYPVTRHGGVTMLSAVAVYALATCAFAVSQSLPLSIAALVAIGASDQLSVSIRNVLVQLRTPDHMRGRVSAVSNIFILTSVQLGDFRAGLVGDLLGPVSSVLLGGLGTLAMVATCPKLFPALTSVDRLEGDEAAVDEAVLGEAAL